jgi:hypothetical protein
MPNGVICGGALDGSNQLGAMVTCQAMTARPEGARFSATAALTAIPNSSVADNARRKPKIRSDIATSSLVFR